MHKLIKITILGLILLLQQMYSYAFCYAVKADTTIVQIVDTLKNQNTCRIHLEVLSNVDKMPLNGSSWQIMNSQKQPIASSVILKNGIAEILFNNIKTYPYILVRYLGYKDHLIHLKPFKGRAVNIKLYLEANEIWIE